MANTTEASRYTVAITDDTEAPRLRKLLAGYGAPDPDHGDPDIYAVFVPDEQMRRIEARHGQHLRIRKE